MKPRLIVHLGPHKTGTTYLQEVVFPSLRSYEFMGRFFNQNTFGSKAYLELMRWVCNGDVRCLHDFSDRVARNYCKPLLLSDEWLTSDYSGKAFQEAPWQKKIVRLSRLKEICEISVFGFVRDPADAVYGLYRQYIREGFDLDRMGVCDFAKTNSADFYNYKKSREFLEKIFSAENVFFVEYESDGISENSLSTILDTRGWPNDAKRVNSTISSGDVLISEKGNYLLTQTSRWVLRYFPMVKELPGIVAGYGLLKKLSGSTIVFPALTEVQKLEIYRMLEWRF